MHFCPPLQVQNVKKQTKNWPVDASLGRRLWVSRAFLLHVTVGSDREWPMLVVGVCTWAFEGEGTLKSDCEGSGWEEGVSRLRSVEPAITPSGLDSDLGMWRLLARVTESGRGKVPMPLSKVLIWQLEPRVTGKGVWQLGATTKEKIRGLGFTCSGRDCEWKGNLQQVWQEKRKKSSYWVICPYAL